jgi:hypothetical protein
MSEKIKYFIIIILVILMGMGGIYISDKFFNYSNKQLDNADEIGQDFLTKSCNLRGNYQGTEDDFKNKDNIHVLVRITANDLVSRYLDYTYNSDKYLSGNYKPFSDNVLHLSNIENIKLSRSIILPNGDVNLYYSVDIKDSKYSEDYVEGIIEETNVLKFSDIYIKVNKEGKVTETNIGSTLKKYSCLGG